MRLVIETTGIKRLYLEWFKTLKAYHDSEIAKHQYKIVKAENKLMERLPNPPRGGRSK